MKKIIILAAFASLNCLAYTGPRLIMTTEKPIMKCEIFTDKVVITKKIGEVKLTKTNNVVTTGLDTLIEKTYIKGPMVAQNTEYAAVYLTRNAASNELETRTFNFNYNDSEFANNLIYVITNLCETR